MQTLLLCFANNRERPLPSLQTEDSGLDRLLTPRVSQGHFAKERESYATADSIADKVLLFQNSLELFHYSGHAGPEALLLEDTLARAQGLAQLLAQCPNLKFIFLNGCSTQRQVDLLIRQGVQAAILATSTPIEDAVATQFSIKLYQGLINQHTLQEAVEQARLQIQLTDALELTTSVISADRGSVDIGEVSRNQWLFTLPNAEAGNWQLSTGNQSTDSDYKPNAGLRQGLFDALRAYDPSLTQRYLAQRDKLPAAALKDWINEELLRRLPFPLAEPLRRLLCPMLSSDGKFIPVVPNQERLIYYLTLFDSSLDLVMITYLAQIRAKLLTLSSPSDASRLSPDALQQLQNILNTGWSEWTVAEWQLALPFLDALLKSWEVPLFVSDFSALAADLTTDSPLYQSYAFFDDLRGRLKKGVANVAALCQVGEEKLALLMKRMGFWAAYRLESYKNIRVIRFFDQIRSYEHERVVLRMSQSLRPDELYLHEVNLSSLWECQSVLLVRNQKQTEESIQEKDGSEFLNLSPFLIDRNVYKKSGNAVFDLYSFRRASGQQLTYRHVARPTDPNLTIDMKGDGGSQSENYGILRDQIQTIFSLVGLVLEPDPSTSQPKPDPSTIQLDIIDLPD